MVALFSDHFQLIRSRWTIEASIRRSSRIRHKTKPMHRTMRSHQNAKQPIHRSLLNWIRWKENFSICLEVNWKSSLTRKFLRRTNTNIFFTKWKRSATFCESVWTKRGCCTVNCTKSITNWKSIAIDFFPKYDARLTTVHPMRELKIFRSLNLHRQTHGKITFPNSISLIFMRFEWISDRLRQHRVLSKAKSRQLRLI